MKLRQAYDCTSSASDNGSKQFDSECSSSDLVDQHGDFLFRYAMLRIGRREIAEDLVQETFLAAIQSHHQFQNRSSIRTWLTGILKNKVVDHLRCTTRDNSLQEILADTQTRTFSKWGLWKQWIHRWEESPETLLEQKAFIVSLEKCLRRLPHRIRNVFTLKVLDDLSVHEIRESLGITEQNIWVTVYRARVQLRECLDINWFRTKRNT